MSATGHDVRPGGEAVVGRSLKSKALEVASKGIESPRDITNFSLAHSIDALNEVHGPRVINASLRGVTTALRAIDVGQRVGQHNSVAGITAAGPGVAPASIDADLAEERELTARLEEVRNRREGRGS